MPAPTSTSIEHPGGAHGLWAATFPEPPRWSRQPNGDLAFDVAIVGAGYTGLWTALSLVDADPGLRVVVVERRTVGFGASGRNGGWCSALLPLGLTALAKRHGREAAIAWQRAMIDTVDRVAGFAEQRAASGIDPQLERGGTFTLARNRAQQRRLESAVAEARRFGFDDGDLRFVARRELEERIRADGVLGAVFTPHCAAVHPLRLVHAIAEAAVQQGVLIAEGVAVVEVEPHRLTTTAGAIRADVVVLATEAYTAELPGRRRAVLPIYSLQIGTEPLDDQRWQQIGLGGRPTFTLASHIVVYGQRTADGRLAFGGRGAPYHYGSRIADSFDTHPSVRRALEDTVRSLFPVLRDVEFPYHWGGPLAAARDWHPHVTYDTATGLASAGGYVGDGVATANLAGRTLADLITGRASDLTRLPWVGHRSRRWEPEPLRWLGVRLVASSAARADRAEASTGRRAAAAAALWSGVVDALDGR